MHYPPEIVDKLDRMVMDDFIRRADGNRNTLTLAKVPPENFDTQGYEPGITAPTVLYRHYVRGDLIPIWPNSKCDTCGVVGGHHFIWDSKRSKWRMACTNHFHL